MTNITFSHFFPPPGSYRIGKGALIEVMNFNCRSFTYFAHYSTDWPLPHTHTALTWKQRNQSLSVIVRSPWACYWNWPSSEAPSATSLTPSCSCSASPTCPPSARTRTGAFPNQQTKRSLRLEEGGGVREARQAFHWLLSYVDSVTSPLHPALTHPSKECKRCAWVPLSLNWVFTSCSVLFSCSTIVLPPNAIWNVWLCPMTTLPSST